MKLNDLELLHKKALAWASNRYHASPQRLHAFANSVVYLMSGFSGGTFGPSIREHLISHSLAGPEGTSKSLNKGLTVLFPDGRLPAPGKWNFEQACQYCSPFAFGPLDITKARHIRNIEFCFDDDPEDIALLSSQSQNHENY